jgi:hypothetical protein
MPPLHAYAKSPAVGGETTPWVRTLSDRAAVQVPGTIFPVSEPRQHLSKVRYVLQDGFVYEGRTLDRVWPTPKKQPRQPWQNKINEQGG